MRSFFAKAILPLILSNILFATENCDTVEKPINIEEAYNAPYTKDIRCSWNIFFNADYIYWQAIEDGLNLAYIDNQNTHSTIKTDFDFKSGFKIGLGANTKYDNWVVYSEYTRLSSHGHSGKTAYDGDSIFPLWISSTIDGGSTIASHAKGLWDLHLNLLDVQLGRPYYVGSKMVLNPYFGLRTVWIDQEFTSIYDLTSPFVSTAKRTVKSDSWGIGPILGIDATYLLSKGFKVIASGDFSLFFQHFDIHNKYTLKRGSVEETHETGSDKIGYLTPNIDALLGIGWGSYFYNHKIHFDFYASYEFQIFWNQNMLRSFKDLMTNNINGASGDLMFHGLTLTAKWDF